MIDVSVIAGAVLAVIVLLCCVLLSVAIYVVVVRPREKAVSDDFIHFLSEEPAHVRKPYMPKWRKWMRDLRKLAKWASKAKSADEQMYRLAILHAYVESLIEDVEEVLGWAYTRYTS